MAPLNLRRGQQLAFELPLRHRLIPARLPLGLALPADSLRVDRYVLSEHPARFAGLDGGGFAPRWARKRASSSSATAWSGSAFASASSSSTCAVNCALSRSAKNPDPRTIAST